MMTLASPIGADPKAFVGMANTLVYFLPPSILFIAIAANCLST